MSDKKDNFEYKRMYPFKWFILENYPFLEDSIDVLTNYQLFCKLGEMYNKEIEVINALGLQVEDITNWFDDLDVQEEINNKLDEMTESGELQEIIASYLNSKAIFCFDNVSDMKNATNLIDGSYARTLGYHDINNGGSLYKIRNITNDDVIDEKFIIEMNDPENNLIAELIYGNEINVDQLGAYGDGVHDDILVLNACRDFCTENHLLMKASSDKIYAISEGFTLLTGCSYDFQNATFKPLDDIQYVIRQHREIATGEGIPVDSDYTKNIVIDCDNRADYGFYQDEFGWSTLTENIRVLNPKSIGVYIKRGQIRLHNVKVEEELDFDRIGLQVDSTDSEYRNVVIRDCSTGIKVTGSSNGFYECHPVMFKTNLLPNSIGFDVNAWNIFVHSIADTFQYGFYFRHYGGSNIIGSQFVINTTYYNDETMNENPTFIYLSHGNDATARVYIMGCTVPDATIINDQKITFTNATKWNSGELLLANPTVNYIKPEGLPKQIMQYNSSTNISSYIQTNYTVTNSYIYVNGNMLEYRINNLVLPAITRNTTASAFKNIPTDLMPENTKYTNAVTGNGVSCLIAFTNGGSIQIIPQSGNISASDFIYFTGSILK